MRKLCWILAAILALTGSVWARGPLPAPEIVIEQGDQLNSIWIEVQTAEGGVDRHLVRETPAIPTPGATGWDPAGQAAFANWSENGRRWSVYSRDAGAGWSEARAIETGLRFLDRAVQPGESLPPAAAGLTLPPEGQVFIVQFRTISLPEWRASLGDLGAELLAFFPHNAHLARIAPELVGQVASLDFVERVEPYQPSYRLEEELKQWLDDETGPVEQRVRVMAFEWGPAGKSRISLAATADGARVAEYWPSGHVLELWVDRGQLTSLAFHDDVMWIDRWSAPETDMNLVRLDSGADWLESNFTYCGQGVRGEVMDNGIQSDHQDFDGIILHTGASVASHGTNTYGCVFGNGNRDGDGDATATGHLPCAQGIFADFDVVTDRFAHTQELKNDPYFASFQSNSWGGARTTAYNSISAEIDDIIWRLDIAILQSQSNAGTQASRPQAWGKNIISVGGIRHQNTLDTADDAWSGGASIGPAADGRIKPDINYWYDNIRTTTPTNSYTSGFGGTSAATPESAGVVGLLIQMWSDNVWNTNPAGNTVFERQPHFSTIKALTINTAQQYTFSGQTADLTRTHQGWGRPNAQLAKERADTSFVVDETDLLTLGQVASYSLTVSAGEPELKVTMIYPDPPGTTSAGLHRINDVSLKVTSPSGTVYHGNVGLEAGNYSTPGGSPNTIDTVENVFVQNPESGSWQVEVEAFEINQDGHLATPATDVAFALVVTGASAGQPVCGDGVREGSEECDGADLGGATCTGEGCTGGTVACTLACTLDFSGCTGCPTCDDNGVCGNFEDCLSCPGDCRTGAGSECGNAICEAADGEDCITCPQDCNGKQGGKPSTRYCCGSSGTCVDARCDQDGKTCTTTAAAESCCGDGTCEGDEDSFNCEIDCGPPAFCGDVICSEGEDSCTCPEDCGAPPFSEVPGSTCTDGQDNDCDGLADCDDADCASSDPACICDLGQAGDACVTGADCCSGKCNGPSGRKTCR